ncbi:hypothetical protein V5O48_010339 [Marasmius crinis-equi]|uniref:Uncharacterized protein n=1 Tax=Marasmius crinis-equi TaxID=585013 RepID=A0ABR3F8L1_9AGAR
MTDTPSPVGLDFLRQCSPKFPTPFTAVNELRRLGKPPSDCNIDIFNPGVRLQTAIKVMGALANREVAPSETVSPHIKAHWKSLIGPWVRVLLEDLILGDQGGPITPEGVITWDHILMCIPGCLATVVPDIKTLNHTTPYLEPLLIQIWLTVIDECHWTWRVWCFLMVNVLATEVSENKNNIEPRRMPYRRNQNTGLILVRHINTHIPKISKMPSEDISALKCFMIMVSAFQDSSGPFTLCEVRLQAIPALVRLASTILFRCYRKIVHPDSHLDRRSNDLHTIVELALTYLCSAMHDSRSVLLALESGLLKVVVKIPPQFLEHDHAIQTPGHESELTQALVSVLDQVAQMIIYPAIRHSFLSSAKKMGVDRVREDSEEDSSLPLVMQIAWKRTQEKAIFLRDMKQIMMDNSMVICANKDVRCTFLNPPAPYSLLLSSVPSCVKSKSMRAADDIKTTDFSVLGAYQLYTAHKHVGKLHGTSTVHYAVVY